MPNQSAQPTNQPTNKPTNQPTNKPIKMCPGWSMKTHGTPPIFVKGPSIFWLDTSHIRFFLLPSVRFNGGMRVEFAPVVSKLGFD